MAQRVWKEYLAQCLRTGDNKLLGRVLYDLTMVDVQLYRVTTLPGGEGVFVRKNATWDERGRPTVRRIEDVDILDEGF